MTLLLNNNSLVTKIRDNTIKITKKVEIIQIIIQDELKHY